MNNHFSEASGVADEKEGSEPVRLAVPLHLQRLEHALRLDTLIRQVQSFVTDVHTDRKRKSGDFVVPINKQQAKAIKSKAYKLAKVKKSKKWIKSMIIDKSDSSDNTDEDWTEDDMVKEMMKFQSMDQKIRKELSNGSTSESQAEAFRCYSTSLLNPTSGEPFAGLSTEVTTPAPKARKTKPKGAAAKRKGSAPEMSVTAASLSPPLPVLLQRSKSETASIADSLSVSTVSTPPLPASLPASLSLSVSDSVESIKKFKLEKMMDEISYDMTLPDEILQSESSDAVPSPSCTAVTDEIIYTSRLPDEIFDTEESSNSLLSQALSSPSSVIPNSTAFAGSQPNSGFVKSATAPPTPTGLSGSIISSKPSGKNSLKWKPTHKQNFSPLSASLSAQTREPLVNAKRRKLWAKILERIPKKRELILAEKSEGLARCREIANWCHQEHPIIRKKWSETSEKTETPSVWYQMSPAATTSDIQVESIPVKSTDENMCESK